MTNEEIIEFCEMKAELEAENEDIYEAIINVLEQQLTRPTAKWINLENTKYKGQVLPFWGRYECSKCGGHGEGTSNFCPNCGARMTESDKE
jgi:rubrerythrin